MAPMAIWYPYKMLEINYLCIVNHRCQRLSFWVFNSSRGNREEVLRKLGVWGEGEGRQKGRGRRT